MTDRQSMAWIAWLTRAAWIAVLVFGAPAIDSATAEHADGVAGVARFGGGLLWLVGVAALAVPAVVTLTTVRLVVPLSIVAAVVALIAGADAAEGVGFLVSAVAATALVLSAELGRGFVQASAYGDEGRFPLRPPLAYAMAATVTWLVWAAALFTGPLLLGDRNWIIGGALTAVAAALGWWGRVRWHKLSRRWLVLVPVGVVVHDHVVLAETLMVRRQELAGLRLALADTQAADLTGPATGHALELLTHEPVTAILAASPAEPRGKAIHLTGALVAPTRPGQVLRGAKDRRMLAG